MVRRRVGALLPIEERILGAGIEFGRAGEEFHGFALAAAMSGRDDGRGLTAHGTLYKALGSAVRAGPAHLALGGRRPGVGRGPATPSALSRDRRRRGGLCAAARARGPLGARSGRRRHDRAEGGDRTTSAVLAWCDWYTRGLPDDVASERRDELAADLHDHRVDATRRDEVDGRHARAVVARALLGAPADLSWRSHQLRIARSARRQEKQMGVAPRRDGRTTVAYVLGGLVVAWSALNVAMLWNLVSVSSNDEDRSVGVGHRPDRARLPRSIGVGADRADPSPACGRMRRWPSRPSPRRSG